MSHSWPGLPAGVKFDPSDVEILEHLAAKCRVGNSTPHMFIDEFIPTLDGDNGICYTHPKNLPGEKSPNTCMYYPYFMWSSFHNWEILIFEMQMKSQINIEH